MKMILQTDGAARGNPGPAAAGGVLLDEKGATHEISEFLGPLTNNEAEYRALILGLERARGLGATALEIRLDSELLVMQLNGQYRVKAANLKPLHAQVMKLLALFSPRPHIRHIPRAMNRRADELANLALDSTR